MSKTGIDPRIGQTSPQVDAAIAAATTNAYPWSEGAPVFGGAAAVLAANTLLLIRQPREVEDRTITSLKIYVGSAGAPNNVDVGMWLNDGTNLVLLSSSGSTVLSGTNAWQTINLLVPQTKTRGLDYHFGFVPDSATPTLGRFNTAAGLLFDGYFVASKASMFPLAANAASLALSGLAATANAPIIRGV